MADLANTDANFAGKTLGDTHSDRHPDPILHFQLEPGVEADDSGGNSPPLWKIGGPSPSRPLLGRHRRLRSDSRADAIARGQWELMEMVKNMPEASYELSLKDLVESNREIEGNGSVGENHGVNPQQRAAARSNRSSPEERRKISGEGKIGGFDNRGVILNTGLPFSARGPKRKVAVVKNHGGGRVSPKVDGLKGGGNGEADWWRKGFAGSSDSDSSRTSGGGGSSSMTTVSSGGRSVGSGGGSRGGGRKNGGCWPFCWSRKGKSKPV